MTKEEQIEAIRLALCEVYIGVLTPEELEKRVRAVMNNV